MTASIHLHCDCKHSSSIQDIFQFWGCNNQLLMCFIGPKMASKAIVECPFGGGGRGEEDALAPYLLLILSGYKVLHS